MQLEIKILLEIEDMVQFNHITNKPESILTYAYDYDIIEISTSMKKMENKMFNVGDLVEYNWFGNMEYSRVMKVYQNDLNQTVVLVSSGAVLPLDCVKKVEE